MDSDAKEKFENFMNKSEVIAIYLRQQVKQGIINQALYKRQVEEFLAAYDDFKNGL